LRPLPRRQGADADPESRFIAANQQCPAALSIPLNAKRISSYEQPFANGDFAVALAVSTS
jgi:hypothetical protein